MKKNRVGIVGGHDWEHVDISKAHGELMEELFGSGVKIDRIHDEMTITVEDGGYILPYVTRSKYTEAMHKIQDKHGLKQGHPQFLEWVFTCVGHSPIIVEDEEGAGENE